MRVDVFKLVVRCEVWHVRLVEFAHLPEEVSSLVNCQEAILVNVRVRKDVFPGLKPILRLHVRLDFADQVPLFLIGRRLLEPVHLKGLVLSVLHRLQACLTQRFLVVEL